MSDNEPVSFAEARRRAALIAAHQAEENRKRAENEARFESRIAFAHYGQAVLTMMIDKGCDGSGERCSEGLSEEEFDTKYGISKQGVNFLLIQLEIANDKQDFAKRNELYDTFIEMLQA